MITLMPGRPTRVRRQPLAGLPVNGSPDYCPLCWTPPGQTHELSCPQVSPEQMAAFLREPRPSAETIRTFRGLLIGVPIGAALWIVGALIAWSLA